MELCIYMLSTLCHNLKKIEIDYSSEERAFEVHFKDSKDYFNLADTN